MTTTGLTARLAIPTALAFGLCLGTPAIAHASSISFTIADIGSYTGNDGYADQNPGSTETFAGQGFLGIYPSQTQNMYAPGLAHLFGLEYYCSALTDSCGIYSETEMEINVSALAGATIISAVLSYDLSDGLDPSDLPGQYGAALPSESVTATSFAATGTLGYNTAPPSDLGSTTFTSTAQSPNSVDVTSLLQSVVSADSPWFGLYLTPLGSGAECDGLNGSAATYNCEGNYQWTYTQPDTTVFPDAADVRLTVDYIPAAVPEPATWGLTALGALVLLARRRRATSK